MRYAALDVGGSKIALCFTDADGGKHRDQVPVTETGDPLAVVSAVIQQLEAWVAQHGHIDTLALASAPAIDANGVVSLWPNRPHWKGTPLAAALAQRLGCKVIWCDDGTAAAMGDAEGLGTDNLLQFTLGTGVAGGIVYRGRSLGDRELGHLTVNPDGPACSCGRKGCLQAYASASSLASEGPEPTPEQEQAWLQHAAAAIATCSANLVELFRVETISLSGGMVMRFPRIPDLVQRRLLDGSLKASLPVPRVVASPHGAEAALWGALRLARSGAALQHDTCRTVTARRRPIVSSSHRIPWRFR